MKNFIFLRNQLWVFAPECCSSGRGGGGAGGVGSSVDDCNIFWDNLIT
jgi:hypothetical protein